MMCLDQDEHQRELLAAKRKKLREEYKVMVEFVEEDKRIRKTERQEIADKVMLLAWSVPNCTCADKVMRMSL